MTLDEACKLVGRFLYHFAEMEAALDGAIGKVLAIEGVTWTVVVAGLDVAKKIAIVQSAIVEQYAKGDETNAAMSTLNSVFALNQDRVLVAHGPFDVTGDAVKLVKLKLEKGIKNQSQTWSEEQFRARFERMTTISKELAAITERLKPFVPSLDFSDKRNSMYITLLS